MISFAILHTGVCLWTVPTSVVRSLPREASTILLAPSAVIDGGFSMKRWRPLFRHAMPTSSWTEGGATTMTPSRPSISMSSRQSRVHVSAPYCRAVVSALPSSRSQVAMRLSSGITEMQGRRTIRGRPPQPTMPMLTALPSYKKSSPFYEGTDADIGFAGPLAAVMPNLTPPFHETVQADLVAPQHGGVLGTGGAVASLALGQRGGRTVETGLHLPPAEG